MKQNFQTVKELIFNRTFFMGTIIVALSSCYIQSIKQVEELSEKLINQQEQTRELGLMLFNTKLEKLDYVESEKEKISQAAENEKQELTEKSLKNINNKFREVHYIRKNSKIVEVDYSDLDISCDSYTKFILAQKVALSDAKFVNKNCDEVK